MDDDGIAEITATLRFDRAILLFWFSNKLLCQILDLFKILLIYCKLQYIKRIFLFTKKIIYVYLLLN
jgi:hypothetical protein